MSTLNIEMKNWEKFNPRSDRANYTWFRLNNDFFDELFSLTSDEKILYIFLLTRASKKNNSAFDLDLNYVCAILQKSEREILKYIHGLTNHGVIMTAESRQKAGMKPAESRHSASLLPATYETNVRDERNETNETNETRRTNTSTELEQVQHHGHFHETENPILQKLLETVKPSTQSAWLAAYPDEEWIKGELLKAHAWIDVNPRKTPKNFSRFFGGWLARGWERYRKTIESKNPNTAYKGITAILEEDALTEAIYARG